MLGEQTVSSVNDRFPRNPKGRSMNAWTGALRFVVALLLVCGAHPANAGGYILSINGPGTVEPGEQFQISAVLGGAGVKDSLIFDVGFTGPRSIIYNGYLLDPVAYQTGGPNDFSIPKGALDTGILTPPRLITNNLYLTSSLRADVHFEAITRDGMDFGLGTLVTLDLTMPIDAQPGEEFTIQGFPGTFCIGCETDWDVGPPLHITVVPEPTTLVLLAFGFCMAIRRSSRVIDTASKGMSSICHYLAPSAR